MVQLYVHPQAIEFFCIKRKKANDQDNIFSFAIHSEEDFLWCSGGRSQSPVALNRKCLPANKKIHLHVRLQVAMTHCASAFWATISKLINFGLWQESTRQKSNVVKHYNTVNYLVYLCWANMPRRNVSSEIEVEHVICSFDRTVTFFQDTSDCKKNTHRWNQIKLLKRSQMRMTRSCNYDEWWSWNESRARQLVL